MHLNKQLSRLVVGVAFTGCIAAALVTAMRTARLKNTGSANATVAPMDWEAELAALLKQPNDLHLDIARMNLLAGSGLSRGEEMALTNLVRELDAMTSRVKAYYNPNAGRRLSRDPSQDANGRGVCSIVHNDSANLLAPFGLWTTGIRPSIISSS